jgi:hypothetical protein
MDMFWELAPHRDSTPKSINIKLARRADDKIEMKHEIKKVRPSVAALEQEPDC